MDINSSEVKTYYKNFKLAVISLVVIIVIALIFSSFIGSNNIVGKIIALIAFVVHIYLIFQVWNLTNSLKKHEATIMPPLIPTVLMFFPFLNLIIIIALFVTTKEYIQTLESVHPE